MPKKLAVGNWKMNGTASALNEVRLLLDKINGLHCDVVLCPPATLLSSMVRMAYGTTIRVGGQDCHQESSGAYTGDISADMISDAGGDYVIVGHSERRTAYHETDSLVRQKIIAACNAQLCPIVCIGESLEQRKAGQTLKQIARQLAASLPDMIASYNIIIAYEPIWAIGSGLTPSMQEIASVHDFIRQYLEYHFGTLKGQSYRILYGGSLNANTISKIATIANVDGGLIGGASLKASDFAQIITKFSHY